MTMTAQMGFVSMFVARAMNFCCGDGLVLSLARAMNFCCGDGLAVSVTRAMNFCCDDGLVVSVTRTVEFCHNGLFSVLSRTPCGCGLRVDFLFGDERGRARGTWRKSRRTIGAW
jgi:hypothetical protein